MVKQADFAKGFTLDCCNLQTGHIVADPRLEPLHETWKPVNARREGSDPHFYQKYLHTKSGEVINSDPRLTAEKLHEKGIKLKKFILVRTLPAVERFGIVSGRSKFDTSAYLSPALPCPGWISASYS
jgi:hypothetical protein